MGNGGFFLKKIHQYLLGHTPGTMETSSMAMFPRLFLPTTPSNTICESKTLL